MKLFVLNQKNNTLALVVPKKIHQALGWVKGDLMDISIGKDRSVVIRKKEEQQKEQKV